MSEMFIYFLRAQTLVFFLETTEAVFEVGADDESVLLQLLLVEHLEDGEPTGGAQWVAAERVEVGTPGQDLRDLGRGHHGAQRVAVADALRANCKQVVRKEKR